MKLTFLGCSHGVPEPGRKCSSVLVTVGKNRYLVDLGCDVMPELITRNVDINQIKGVFICHPHGDHCNGIFAFADLLNWYCTKADPTILVPIDGVKEIVDKWSSLMTGGNEPRPKKIEKYTAGVIYDDGVMKVTAIPNEHCNDSYSFLLEAEGKRVLYTGDLNHKTHDFPQEAVDSGLDFLIGEAAHFSVMKYVDFLKDKPVKAAAITHHYAPNSKDFLAAKKELSPLPFTLAFDGMEFDV